MLARERQAFLGEEAAHDLHRLGQSLQARARRIECQARLEVVGLEPAGAEAKLQAPAGQRVDRRRFFGQRGRMAEVIVEHDRAESDARSDRGRGHQRGQRRELFAEVVGHDQRVEAEVFGTAGEVLPLAQRAPKIHHAEAERAQADSVQMHRLETGEARAHGRR